MNKLASVGALVALAVPGATFAAGSVSHTFLEGGYVRSEVDVENGLRSNGLRLAGSYELPASVVLDAAAETVDYNRGVKGWQEYQAGVKYKLPLAANFDVLAGVSGYLIDNIDAVGFSNLKGFGLNVGARTLVTDRLLASAQVEYVDYDKDLKSTFALSLGARWYFTPAFSGGVDFYKTDKLYASTENRFRLQFRYDFGPAR
jgi:hypothetical protein